MRVLFSTWAAASHFFPMVPLAWALQAAGHQVRVACQPALAQAVAACGLTPAVTGHDVDVSVFWRGMGVTATAAPATTNGHGGRAAAARAHAAERSQRALRMFASVAGEIAGDVTAFARDWRCDLVVYEPRAYAGLIAAARLGRPAVRHVFGVDYTWWRRDLERADLAPLWRRTGLDGVDVHGTLTIDPFPPSAQIPRALPVRTVRPVPYNGREVVPRWLTARRHRPRVCATWGTTFAKTAGHLRPLQAVIAGLRGLGVEVVVAIAAGQRDLLGGVDDDGVRVVEALPLSLLLPTCDAVVHQGGPGTALAAIVGGVPQLMVPSIGDQPLCAARVAEAGAGRVVEFADLDADAVRAAAGDLLDQPAYGAATHRLRAEAARQPSPAAVVRTLERLC